MEGHSPGHSLTLVDFLDVALLGAIALSIGLGLLPPLLPGTPPSTGRLESALVSVVQTLGSVSGPVESLGVLLTIVGSAMVLIGPLWILLGRPLSRRGYL